ncbi:MAG: fimbrial protein FimV [Methylomonas sp.]|nr:MAG: fimbrial protein FimV [Methylomonas sp.]
MHLIDRAEVIPVKEKNVKHLTKTLAVVSLLLPMSAQPLGIGDIQLHSALNQKLNAEIHLHLAAGENPSDISVRLAPPEKFDQAGIPWNYVLSKIKFQPVVQPNGSVIVKVTSREPLTEPFLDFLLEVTWPQGSQFREFTVLVDPPAEYHTPVTPSSQLAAASDYRLEQLAENDRPIRKAKSGSQRIKRAQSAAPNISPQTPSSGEYGPTQTSDTLWRIAEQLGSERNVSTKQMLTALHQANPDAFNRGNMDSLKTGVILKIPETDAIVQASGKASAKPVRKPAAANEQTANLNNKALELVAPTDSKITDKTDLNSQTKPGPETGDGHSSAGAGGHTDGKDLALQSRIEKLEQQLNMMQQLLALKDQQLATLQSSGKEPTKPDSEPTPPETVDEPAATPATPQAPASPTVTPAEQPTPVTPVAPPAETKPTPAAVEPPKPVKPATPPPPPVVEEDFFSSSTYYWTVGGLSAGMLGLLGWLLWRKRKIESLTNTESMFASASQIKMPDADSSLAVPVMDINSTGAYDVGTVGESSFISDFTPSDFEAFDTDQNDIDPMSEADVYLAYGRYQQAEDLIRHAIKDQPNKDEYKLKLLEIFYANENKERFAAYTQELAHAGKNNDVSFWHKVSEMAKEIIPESALFGGTEKAMTPKAAPVTTETSAPDPFTSVDQDLNFSSASLNDDLIDLNAPTLPDMALMDEINSELAELQLNLPEASDDNGLDFDLSSFSKPDPKAAANVESAPTDIESIDFDLSGLDIKPEADTKQLASEDTLESFDFNFELNSPKLEPETDSQTLDIASLESFEFPEFGDSADIEEKSIPQPVAPAPENALSLDTSDEFDFNFDFEAPSSSKSKSSDDDIDFGVSDLTDMDEFETKIDLAKAYIDMGDADAAKSIAQEVLEKGTPEQKQAAQALLDELK